MRNTHTKRSSAGNLCLKCNRRGLKRLFKSLMCQGGTLDSDVTELVALNVVKCQFYEKHFFNDFLQTKVWKQIKIVTTSSPIPRNVCVLSGSFDLIYTCAANIIGINWAGIKALNDVNNYWRHFDVLCFDWLSQLILKEKTPLNRSRNGLKNIINIQIKWSLSGSRDEIWTESREFVTNSLMFPSTKVISYVPYFTRKLFQCKSNVSDEFRLAPSPRLIIKELQSE